MTGQTDLLALLERLLARGRREGACLMWPGAHNAKGYGRFQCRPLGLTNTYVHRFVCWMVHGLRDDQVARHTCDRPGCIEPEHLVPDTQQGNVDDAMAKGRLKKPPVGRRGINVTNPSATTIRRREAKRKEASSAS